MFILHDHICIGSWNNSLRDSGNRVVGSSACRFGKRKEWYNTPMDLKGKIGADEKDLGLKTSDLGLTSDIGRSLKWEVWSRASAGLAISRLKS